MKFVINNLKYDTSHMKLISDKCKYSYQAILFGTFVQYSGKNVKLWVSKKDNWLLTYEDHLYCNRGVALSKREVEQYLLKYDLDVYEKEFGPLEEA